MEVERQRDPFLVPNINLRAQPREKKVKTITEALFIAKRKRRSKNPPSEAQKWADEITRKGLKTLEDIRSYFAQNLVSMTDANYGFYKMIAESKVINNKLHLTDSLANTPLVNYFFIDRVSVKVITNDWLYLASCFKYRLSQLQGNADYKEFVKNSTILNVTYVSKSFNADWTYTKGYYQDFKDDFSAIGTETLSNENRTTLIGGRNPVNTFDFSYAGSIYKTRDLNGSCIISKNNATNQEITDNLNNIKIITVDKKVSLNPKSIKINDKVKYIDTKVKPEKFCPAYLLMPDPVECAMLVKISYDYNDFFEKLKTKYNNNRFYLPVDFIIWENIPQCFDVLAVLSVTTDISNDLKNRLNGIYGNYIKYKVAIDLWKKNQLDFSRILTEFYHSFQDKINIDKLNRINEKVVTYIENRGQLTRDSSYEFVKNFFEDLGDGAKSIRRQFDPKVFAIADAIRDVTNKIAAGVEDLNLAAEIRKVALAIYDVSLMTGTSNSLSCFNFIVSPGAFLSDLSKGYDNVDNEDPLSDLVNNLNRRNQEVQINNNQRVDQIAEIMNQMPEQKEIVISGSVQEYTNRNGIRLEAEEIDNVIAGIRTAIANNQVRARELERRIINAKVSRQDINTVLLNDDVIRPFVNQALTLRQQAALRRQENENNLRQEQNMINNQINNLEMQNVEQQSEPVSSIQQASSGVGVGSVNPFLNITTTTESVKVPAQDYYKRRNEIRTLSMELQKKAKEYKAQNKISEYNSVVNQINSLTEELKKMEKQ